MRIIVPYSENVPWKRRAPCFKALRKIGRPFDYVNLDKYKGGYDQFLLDEWPKAGDLCLVEHDMGIKAEMLDLMESCPYDACVQDYLLFDAVSAQRAFHNNRFIENLRYPAAFADLYGFGIVRWREQWRKAHPWTLDDIGRQDPKMALDLDARFSWHSYFFDWGPAHVHYPTAKHYHGSRYQWAGASQLPAGRASAKAQRIYMDGRTK